MTLDPTLALLILVAVLGLAVVGAYVGLLAVWAELRHARGKGELEPEEAGS